MAYDERVLRKKGLGAKRDYGQTLLDLSVHRLLVIEYPLAFGENTTKERVKKVVKIKKSKVWVTILAELLCLGVMLSCVPNAYQTNGNRNIGIVYLEEYFDAFSKVTVEVDNTKYHADITKEFIALFQISTWSETKQFSDNSPLVSIYLQEENWLYLYKDGRASIYYSDSDLLKKERSYYSVPAEVANAIKVYALEHGDKDIYGYYRYVETIYRIPLSSYMMLKANAADYVITEESVTILYTDGTKEQITASFEKSKVDEEAFAALFMPKIGMPDISGFKQCHQYSINEQYRLYVMDGEVWLAQCPRDTMWGIYRLVKVEDDYDRFRN